MQMPEKFSRTAEQLSKLSRDDFHKDLASCCKRLKNYYNLAVTDDLVADFYTNFLATCWLDEVREKESFMEVMLSDREIFGQSFGFNSINIMGETVPFTEFIEKCHLKGENFSGVNSYSFNTYVTDTINSIVYSYDHGDCLVLQKYPEQFAESIKLYSHIKKSVNLPSASYISPACIISERLKTLKVKDLKSNGHFRKYCGGVIPKNLNKRRDNTPVLSAISSEFGSFNDCLYSSDLEPEYSCTDAENDIRYKLDASPIAENSEEIPISMGGSTFSQSAFTNNLLESTAEEGKLPAKTLIGRLELAEMSAISKSESKTQRSGRSSRITLPAISPKKPLFAATKQ